MNALGIAAGKRERNRTGVVSMVTEKRRRISLPTYPFERKRFWIDAPAVEESSPLAAPQVAAQDLDHSRETTTSEEKREVNPNIQTPTGSDGTATRRTKIARILEEVFEELSGVNVSQADGSTSFLEMGFDSLFLTQVTQELHDKFGLKITFRQLLSDLSSIDTLSEYIDGKLSPGVLAEPVASPAPASNVTAPLATSDAAALPTDLSLNISASAYGDTAMPESPVERLMREQLSAMNQLFAKQLEALRGTTAAPGLASSPTTASAVPLRPRFLPFPPQLQRLRHG